MTKEEALALRILSQREHSSGELRRKLSQRGVAGELIEEILEKFIESGYIDDGRFAAAFTAEYTQRGYGGAWIARQLRSRGVEPELIPASETDEQALDRIVSRYKFPLDAGEKRRLYNTLTRRGYGHAEIMESIKRNSGDWSESYETGDSASWLREEPC